MMEQPLVLIGILRYYLRSIDYYLFLGGERMTTLDYMVARLRTTSPSGYLIHEWFDLESEWIAPHRKIEIGALPFKEQYETV